MAEVQSLGTLPAQGSQPLALFQLAPGAGPRSEVTLPANATHARPNLTGYSYTHDAAAPRILPCAGQERPT